MANANLCKCLCAALLAITITNFCSCNSSTENKLNSFVSENSTEALIVNNEVGYDNTERITINTNQDNSDCTSIDKSGRFYWSGEATTMSISGQISQDKVKEIYNLIFSCEMTEFNAYQPDENGIMIWKYPDHYIEIDAKLIDGHHTYILTEDDFAKVYKAIKKINENLQEAQNKKASEN